MADVADLRHSFNLAPEQGKPSIGEGDIRNAMTSLLFISLVVLVARAAIDRTEQPQPSESGRFFREPQPDSET